METQIFTEEIFGHDTDFELKSERVGDDMNITLTAVIPRLVKSGDIFVAIKPPRYPWPNTP